MSARWEDQAACRGMDPDIFFPEQHESGEGLAFAKAICANCPVKRACLEIGLGEYFGVWGGTSERQRRKIRKQRRAASKEVAA